jgi:hypothetical protein
MRKLALATATVFCLLVSLAAAEQTRETYKAQVEPICQVNAKANERILTGVRKLVKQGKLTQAGAKFLKAGAALKKTYTQLNAVEKPPSDAARLTKWLGYVKKESELFTRGGKALKAKNKHKAQKIVNELTETANQANATVISFSFHYCRFEPSKFT